MAVIRKAFAIQVPRESLPEYERRHREMDAVMRAEILGNGSRSFALFAAPHLNIVIMNVEIEDPDHWASSAVSEVTARWWAYMADLMPTNADGSPLSIELPLVFELDHAATAPIPKQASDLR